MDTKTLTEGERAEALGRLLANLQNTAGAQFTDDDLRDMLCAAFGHPPVVKGCFGQVTCARCGTLLGDVLLSTYDMEKKALIGHDCETCRAVIAGLTPEQALLTPTALED
jgi:hypothetical protein